MKRIFDEHALDDNEEETNHNKLNTTFVNYKMQGTGLKKIIQNNDRSSETHGTEKEHDFSSENFGGIVGSKTGQKYFVGSSSMTHFCMEIHSLIGRTKAMIEDNFRKIT